MSTGHIKLWWSVKKQPDSFNIYHSLSPFSPTNLPVPVATGLAATTREFRHLDQEYERDHYYRIASVKNGRLYVSRGMLVRKRPINKNVEVPTLQIDSGHYIDDYSKRYAYLTFAINDNSPVTTSTYAYQSSYSAIFKELTPMANAPFNLIWGNDGRPFIFYQPGYYDYIVLYNLHPIEPDSGELVGTIKPQTNTITFYPTDVSKADSSAGFYDFYTHLLQYNGLPSDTASFSITSNYIGSR